MFTSIAQQTIITYAMIMTSVVIILLAVILYQYRQKMDLRSQLDHKASLCDTLIKKQIVLFKWFKDTLDKQEDQPTS